MQEQRSCSSSSDMPSERGWLRLVITLCVTLILGGSGLTFVLGSRAAASTLPDGRAFELVTPPDTNGNTAVQVDAVQNVVVDDDHVVYGGGVAPDGASPSGFNPFFLATRTSTGWTSASLLPPTSPPNTAHTLVAVARGASAVVLETGPVTYEFPAAPNQNVDDTFIYRSAAGQFSRVSVVPTDQAANGASQLPAGVSADGKTFVYASDDTPSGAPNPGGLRRFYAWHPGGDAQQIEGGSGDPLAQCGATPVSNSQLSQPNTVSGDGSTVFMQSVPGSSPCPANSQVYASTDGRSQEVSVSTDGTSDPQDSASEATFVGATPDGRTAYFVTVTPLTGDALATAPGTAQLYRWTEGADGQAESVTCVSCSAGGFVGGSNEVVVSSRGDYVYFTEHLPSGDTHLMVAHGPQLQTVDSSGGYQMNLASFQLSQDGKAVAFVRDSQLWRAVVDPPAAPDTSCLTCQDGGGGIALGFPGDSGLYTGDSSLAGGDNAVAAGGNMIVYQTNNGFAADNGSAFQVYEWSAAAGNQLIADGLNNSLGTTSGDAAITADGHDIFFFSPDVLTFDDEQPGVPAMYDARVGGGFAAPGSGVSCAGDACQGASPGGVTPGSGSSTTCCGNLAGRVAPLLSIAKLSSAQLAKSARTGRLTIDLSVTGAGRLRVDVRAMRGRASTRIKAFTRRLTRVTHHKLGVDIRLPTQLREQLRRGGRVSIRVTATFPGTLRQQRTIALRLRRSNGGRS